MPKRKQPETAWSTAGRSAKRLNLKDLNQITLDNDEDKFNLCVQISGIDLPSHILDPKRHSGNLLISRICNKIRNQDLKMDMSEKRIGNDAGLDLLGSSAQNMELAEAYQKKYDEGKRQFSEQWQQKQKEDDQLILERDRLQKHLENQWDLERKQLKSSIATLQKQKNDLQEEIRDEREELARHKKRWCKIRAYELAKMDEKYKDDEVTYERNQIVHGSNVKDDLSTIEFQGKLADKDDREKALLKACRNGFKRAYKVSADEHESILGAPDDIITTLNDRGALFYATKDNLPYSKEKLGVFNPTIDGWLKSVSDDKKDEPS